MQTGTKVHFKSFSDALNCYLGLKDNARHNEEHRHNILLKSQTPAETHDAALGRTRTQTVEPERPQDL